jgi:hypothetical protein
MAFSTNIDSICMVLIKRNFFGNVPKLIEFRKGIGFLVGIINERAGLRLNAACAQNVRKKKNNPICSFVSQPMCFNGNYSRLYTYYTSKRLSLYKKPTHPSLYSMI